MKKLSLTKVQRGVLKEISAHNGRLRAWIGKKTTVLRHIKETGEPILLLSMVVTGPLVSRGLIKIEGVRQEPRYLLLTDLGRSVFDSPRKEAA